MGQSFEGRVPEGEAWNGGRCRKARLGVDAGCRKTRVGVEDGCRKAKLGMDGECRKARVEVWETGWRRERT